MAKLKICANEECVTFGDVKFKHTMEFCSKCGTKLFSACKKCRAVLSEESEDDLCENCKKPDIDKDLKEAIEAYNSAYTLLNDRGMELHIQRQRAIDLIDHIEHLINNIANHPKDFDAQFEIIQVEKKEFTSACDYAKQELDSAKKSAAGIGGGVAAGAAVASIAPTAAMWIATTFGTASTGTAISALSGAAAQSAALAWLGGGALATGGGGMAAGSAFLAMAGPVGWSIAGVSVLASVTLFTVGKIKSAKKKTEEIETVKRNTEALNEAIASIQSILDETSMLRERLTGAYEKCMFSIGKSFMDIPIQDQKQLGILVNNTKALAMTLRKNIVDSEKE